jgi:hypothetical protein
MIEFSNPGQAIWTLDATDSRWLGVAAGARVNADVQTVDEGPGSCCEQP